MTGIRPAAIVASSLAMLEGLACGGRGCMATTITLERPVRPRRARGPLSDLVTTKLLPPWRRPGTVCRSSLINLLDHGDPPPIVSVVAPAGYGKTTLLSQWAGHNDQPFAWVLLDGADNDPKVMLTYIAQALDAVEPIDGRVFDALEAPASSVPGSVVPRLGAAFSSMTSPVVLVLDDVHLLHNSECRAALSVLADHVAGGSRLALAGREQPPLRIARLRAEGRILEVGPGDLSLTRGEASSLLRNAGLTLAEDEVAVLHRQTEGWPAALYLAALYLSNGGPAGGAASFGGDDQLISEYIESEFLARLSRADREFLTWTAVLERMCGPLCDAVLGRDGSAAALAGLARSNLLLVPLDRREQWYRYHHLFRDMLLADLERQAPGLIPVLRRRAASWCLDSGLPEEALEYSIAAADAGMAAHLVEKLWIPTYQRGQVATLWRWLQWLDEHNAVEGHPMVAAAATLVSTVTGRPVEAERWADIVDRWQRLDPDRPADAYLEAWAAMLRALLCRNGTGQMRADADEAERRFAALGIANPGVALLQGTARVLSGDLDGGDAYFQDVVSMRDTGAPDVIAQALAERSLVAMAGGDWQRAVALASQARSVLRRAQIEESDAAPLVCAVQARALLHRRATLAARQELVTAQRMRHLLTYAHPQVAVQARIELVRAHLALADLAGARTLMQEIDELLKRRPGMGTLDGEAEALRAQLASERGSIIPGPSALTAAELRLLPMLSTHLPVREIATEMFLSPHTIRTQGKSIYRKLGATSRSQAIARARELGLLEG